MWLTNPVEFVGETEIEAVKCIKMQLGDEDNYGRRRPIPIEGSEFTIPADMVLLALGQSTDEDFISLIPGINMSNGTILADPLTGKTSNPRIFAGGDLVHGAKEVVDAVQTGKLTAESINESFQTESK